VVGHLRGRILQQFGAGVANKVPYRGAGPAIQGLLGGGNFPLFRRSGLYRGLGVRDFMAALFSCAR
jgi:hypothetical protein